MACLNRDNRIIVERNKGKEALLDSSVSERLKMLESRIKEEGPSLELNLGKVLKQNIYYQSLLCIT